MDTALSSAEMAAAVLPPLALADVEAAYYTTTLRLSAARECAVVDHLTRALLAEQPEVTVLTLVGGRRGDWRMLHSPDELAAFQALFSTFTLTSEVNMTPEDFALALNNYAKGYMHAARIIGYLDDTFHIWSLRHACVTAELAPVPGTTLGARFANLFASVVTRRLHLYHIVVDFPRTQHHRKAAARMMAEGKLFAPLAAVSPTTSTVTQTTLTDSTASRRSTATPPIIIPKADNAPSDEETSSSSSSASPRSVPLIMAGRRESKSGPLSTSTPRASPRARSRSPEHTATSAPTSTHTRAHSRSKSDFIPVLTSSSSASRSRK